MFDLIAWAYDFAVSIAAGVVKAKRFRFKADRIMAVLAVLHAHFFPQQQSDQACWLLCFDIGHVRIKAYVQPSDDIAFHLQCIAYRLHAFVMPFQPIIRKQLFPIGGGLQSVGVDNHSRRSAPMIQSYTADAWMVLRLNFLYPSIRRITYGFDFTGMYGGFVVHGVLPFDFSLIAFKRAL